MSCPRVAGFRLGCGSSQKVQWFRVHSRRKALRAKYQSYRRPFRRMTLHVSAASTNSSWVGRDIFFMQSNDHPRDRQGVWNSTDVHGAVKVFVEKDKDAGSWLKKLQVVKGMIVEKSETPDVDSLALSHIYLSWVNNGVIPCVESGGHFRPKHHAELSKSIFWKLERNTDLERQRGPIHWISRALHMKLPSFAEEFRRAEPLTRIRDLAHRNDIPKDIKHEIKHTLQNKLHRNAGPEDLVAAELMYEKIMSQKDHLNDDFIKQYGLFMEELREFFNAGNLAETLRKVRRSMYGSDEAGVQIINRFLELQAEIDGGGYQSTGSFDLQTNEVMETLHAVTSVRALLLSKLSSGVRNDAPDEALVMRQAFRLAEIRSEDYSFVLLSRYINLLEGHDKSFDQLVKGGERSWALPLGALVLGLRNIALTGWEPQECMAIENEISRWHQLGELHKPLNALRMRASLERLQRLCSQFCDSILDAFVDNVQNLGKALGVSGHHVTVYSESEIRANVVFQVSKLTSFLLKASRQAAGQSAWDIIVPGISRGRLVEVNSIDSIALPSNISSTDKLILVVKKANGEEDVGHLVSGFTGAGMKVTGIILRQELPHLSHLGVRARQEHLVFTTCTDEELIHHDLSPLLGEYTQLKALPEGVRIERCTAGESMEEDDVHKGPLDKIEIPSFQDSEATVLFQSKAGQETCGAKAANCGIIESISSKFETFKAPTGVVLPFGVMERCMTKDVLSQISALLKHVDEALDKNQDIEELTISVQELIKCQTIPQWITKTIKDEFNRNERVILRSSANVEDLAGLSGAGLHDSIANMNSHNVKQMEEAILRVWASLYTKRALMARHSARLSHENARMAVLIQQQLTPVCSFVLHTTDPLTKDSNILTAEIAPGIGETLASGTQGTPWRLTINKKTGKVETTAFANFSSMLLPKAHHDEEWSVEGKVMTKVADYSTLALSVDDENRELLGKRLLSVGEVLEKEFGGIPQDIEGAVVGNELYIVQSRPQPI